MLNPKDNSESTVNAREIDARAEALEKASPAAVAEPEIKEEPKLEAKEEGPKPQPKVEAKETIKEPKAPTKEAKTQSPTEVTDNKVEKPKSDSEVRKWATKTSQENAQLRKDLQALRESVEKMTKKPLDLNELSKNPEQLQKLWQDREAEFAKLNFNLLQSNRAFQTSQISQRRLNQPEEYPNWNKAAKIMEDLVGKRDPGFLNLCDWGAEDPEVALDKGYEYVKPMIDQTDWSKIPGFEDKQAIAEAEINKRIEAARKEAYNQALEESRARANGSTVAGMGGAKTGRTPTTPDYNSMDMKSLEKLLKKQSGNA
jgi:hypothetical protein